jgi:hypothetical protein
MRTVAVEEKAPTRDVTTIPTHPVIPKSGVGFTA